MSEESETVPCDVCAEVFPTISKAITHKHKVHPDHDAKYFCPWCGKLFTMKHLQNKHIASTHSEKEDSEEKGFHCDYCDTNFFLPTAMLYHNKFFHRQDTELAAIGQSRKLKIFNQQPLPLYYCPFCGEEYFNKVNLHKHMGDDHSDENQSPADILRCPLCDAIFYHLDAYEVHLTFHSSEDMYSEENELLKEVTEFSLETTPPIMEKVENDTAEDGEQSIGIESFLQQAMNESVDTDISDLMPEKRKKHKKHKKSKKSITLDEFLNMNKDVFGEGIDVQGIEEVPTQVVAKHLKKPTKLQARAKATQPPSSDIEKLKRQGIVITKKSGAIPLKFSKKVLKKPTNVKQDLNVAKILATANVKTDDVNTNKVLSKFFNQNNSQLKIVKKSTAEALNIEKDVPSTAQLDNDSLNEKGAMRLSKEENKADTQENNEVAPETENQPKPKTQESNHNDSENNDSSHSKTSENDDLECGNKNEEKLSSHKEILNEENKDIIMKNKSDLSKMTDCTSSEPNVYEKADLNSTPSNSIIHTVIKNISIDDTIKSKNEDEVSNKSSDQHHGASSLNVLKHLSNLVVKSVSKKTEVQNSPENYESDGSDCNDSCQKETKRNQGDHKSDTLKNLSQHLTIKSINHFKNSSQNISSTENSNIDKEIRDEDDIDKLSNEEDNVNKKHIFNNIKVNTSVQQPRSPVLKSSPTPCKAISELKNSPTACKVMRSPQIKELRQNEQNARQIQQTDQKCQTANLLRNLPNITAKTVNTSKNIQQDTTLVEKSSKQILNEKNKVLKSEASNKEIEIFNIDDSDDEDVNSQDVVTTKKDTSTMPLTPSQSDISGMSPIQNAQNNSENILKNISKHITIKQKNVPQAPKILGSVSTNNTKNDILPAVPDKTKMVEKQNEVLHNALKNLSKNITIKSNNNQISDRPPSKDSLLDNDYESDNENCQKKLAISECDNDDFSDNEFDNDNINQAIVEYPDGDNSENEDYDGRLLDVESEIKTNKLAKPVYKKPLEMYNSKVRKDVLNSFNNFDTDEDQFEDEAESYNIPNINNELSIKPFNPTKACHPENATANTNFKEVTQKIANQNLNERNSTSSNQVTQEVSVKTIQSKTVVQEITTTVTKTIRTVNQSVKQDIRSLNQGSTSSQIRPQKIQGIRPQQIKNFPGTPIRQATPVQGPRIQSTTMQSRPAVRTPVRPCNQLVPVRSSANTIRPNAPRNPNVGVRKPAPKCSAPRPAMAKPLKISPNAVISTTKRPSEESSGPFSCFKKQRESLLPVPEFTDFDSDQEGPSSVQYTSSHISKSNFMSSTSSVKANKVVTSNQMKSETSACSQLKKLSNVSGLKIMKTCQIKQITQVEDSNENSAKRSALEAIEKLQKQGLLLKKPRHEELNSEHTDSKDEHLD